MTTFRNIVVGTDFSAGSQAALGRAVQLAQAHGASLRLLHAFDISAWHSLRGIFDPRRLAMDPPPDVRLREHLSELATSLATQTGLQVEALFSVGDADSAISAYVSAHDTALLVLGSRAEPGMAGLGSTASKLLWSPTCPVLVVRVGASRPYDKVLCAVDLRAGSIRAAARATAWFPAAHHWLLCALDLELERAFWMDAAAPEQTRAQHDSMRAVVLRQLEQLARELGSQTAHPVLVDVLDDVPSRAIVERAAALPADCVVVGHHGQAGGATHLLGGLAQHVLQHTVRDVLVVP